MLFCITSNFLKRVGTLSPLHHLVSFKYNCFKYIRAVTKSEFEFPRRQKSITQTIETHFTVDRLVRILRSNHFWKRPSVKRASNKGRGTIFRSVTLKDKQLRHIHLPPEKSLTIMPCGNPRSKGITSSRYLICSVVRLISNASMLSVRCSTFLPPIMGKT